MASLSQDYTVNITVATRTPTRPGFGTILVADVTPAGAVASFGSDLTQSFSDLSEMTDAGYVSTDSAYLAAAAAFAQSPRVRAVKVLARATPVAQVDTITVAQVQNSTNYTVTINGTAHTIASDGSATDVEIRDALISAINAGAQASLVTAASATSSTFTITSDVAGVPFTATATTANLSRAATTPSTGIEDDLDDVTLEDDDWYGLVITQRHAEVAKRAAAWVESAASAKMFLFSSDDTGVLSSGSTTDIAYVLESLARARSGVLYHADDDEFAETAWTGRLFPYDAGSASWHAKTLAGITEDALTTTQSAAAFGKNANTYEDVGGYGWTRYGTLASGLYIDLRISIDWLTSEILGALGNLQAQNLKIPYTNAGAQMCVNALRPVFDEAVRRNIITADYVIEAEDVADQSTSDRSNRIFPGLTFSATFQGAMHQLTVNGNIGY